MADASPIIALSKINRVDLLLRLSPKLVITNGVRREIDQTANPKDRAKVWLKDSVKDYVSTSVTVDMRIAAWDLGLGENEVLSYCILNRNSVAVVDDFAARKCAAIFGIEVRGTLSIILLAKRRKLIPLVRQPLQDLIDSGFRIEANLARSVLRLAGEE